MVLNVSATLNVARLLANPSLCLPHLTLKSFDQLPLPVRIPGQNTEIKGLVLDKDNCFAKDKDDKVWPKYNDTWEKMVSLYPKSSILIVSNSAGTNDDRDYSQAQVLEKNTGITVLRHSTKKPGCHDAIEQYFASYDIKPNEIAIVGDRLFTDILMANMMGSWGIWLSEGVELSQAIFPRTERAFYSRFGGNSGQVEH